MKPTKKTNLSELDTAELRRELGHAARGNSRFPTEQIHEAMSAASRRAAEKSAAEELQREDDERTRQAEAHRAAQARTNEAHAALMALVGVGEAEDAKEQALMDANAKRKATAAEAVKVLEAALGKPVDGDATFFMADHALIDRLGFHGLPIHGHIGHRELPPGVKDSVAQTVGNLMGQLRIHARARGLTLPA